MTTIAPPLADFQRLRRQITINRDRTHHNNIDYIRHGVNEFDELFNPANNIIDDNLITNYNNIVDNIITDMINDNINHNDSNIDHIDSNIQHIDSNIQHIDSNIQHIDSNIDRNDSNIQHIDSNIDRNDSNIDNIQNLFNNRLQPPVLLNLTIESLYRSNIELGQQQELARNQQREINRLTQEVSTLTEQIDLLAESASPTALCAVCMTQPRNYANSSCGHLCACANCIIQLGDTCPICRAAGHFVRIVSS